MSVRSCECGTCKVCRRRVWQQTWREKNREYHNAYMAERAHEKRAERKQARSYAITLEEAEEMDMERWMRLPAKVQARIVAEYAKERAS